MKPAKQTILGCLLLAVSAAMSQTSSAPAPESPKSHGPQQKGQTTSPDRGAQVFHENCSRCHQEPQGFSPSISGTVARHMRVRAGLSDADYKALLKFLNP